MKLFDFTSDFTLPETIGKLPGIELFCNFARKVRGFDQNDC